MLDVTQDITGMKRLMLSKYYLGLAENCAKSSREVDVFVAINLLHEAVETFLVAAAAHVNAAIGNKEEFAGYIDKIDKKISPNQLPFRSKLIRLNKARIMVKHDSVVPERSELPGFLISVREFLVEASSLVFSADFRTVSLINALPKSKQRDLLQEAHVAFENGKYSETLIACRKAIYLEYEQSFDARIFENRQINVLASLFSKVPDYARDKSYFLNNVKEPTDYIVLDTAKVDSKLVKDGLDSHQFWNVWRLTPRVYLADGGRWIVRHEPDKVEGPNLEENAAYVLEQTVDHFIQLARVRARQRRVTPSRWTVMSGPSGARLFVRASSKSEIAHTVPAGVTLNVEAATEGFEEGEMFWKVTSSFIADEEIYFGYALESELKFNQK